MRSPGRIAGASIQPIRLLVCTAMDTLTLLKSSTNDLASFLVSVLLVAAYPLFLRHKIKNDPAYTVQAINRIARTAWVETIMQDDKNAVLAVQTLRNSTMAA